MKTNEHVPITMKDIAQALGVSVATVSRALNDSPRISAERKEAIKAYAREHNFAPNMIAESLRHSRVHPIHIIGVIVPQINHFYFSSILSGIEEEASARGYQLMVAQSDELYEREVRICQSFYISMVCGIIVSQAKDTTHYFCCSSRPSSRHPMFATPVKGASADGDTSGKTMGAS